MKDILIQIIKSCGIKIISLISSICASTRELFKYLNKCFDKKEAKEKEKKDKKFEQKIKDVCDNGSLKDLFDLKR